MHELTLTTILYSTYKHPSRENSVGNRFTLFMKIIMLFRFGGDHLNRIVFTVRYFY
jgi:hypothetical protein